MSVRPWRQALRRHFRRRPRRRGPPLTRPPASRAWRGRAVALSLLVALAVAASLIWLIMLRIRPLVAATAQTQAQNTMTARLEQAIVTDLSQREISYSSFVTIQRDETGQITALSTDMAAMNLLRANLIANALESLEGIEITTIEIPLGSVFDNDLVWARGPSIKARAMRVGTVSAEFESEFSSAGVNQTIHRIWLEMSVPMRLMLPGGSVEVPLDTRLCVAETVIVGQVPNTYLNLDQPGA